MAVATSPDNRITLNGLDYALVGPVKQQPASEFQAELRVGSPQYDNREGAFILSFEDTSGGMGVLAADERQNEHMRPRYASSETRFPRLHCLPGLVTSVALTGVAMGTIPQGAIKQWKDVLIIAAGDKVFKMTSALTVTDITPTNKVAEVGAGAMTSDLLIHDFNDGAFANAALLLWGLKSVAGGSTKAYYVNGIANPVATDWSAQGGTPLEELNSMVSFDQKVMKIQGAVMKESNEGVADTWGDLAVSPFDKGTWMEVPLYSYFIGTHRVPFGPDFMPWLILGGDGGYSGKVAMLDYWSRQLKPLELNIGRVAGGLMMDEGVVLSTTYDVWKVLPGDPPTLRPMGLRRGQGLDPRFAGAVVSGMGTVSGELVVGMTNLKTSTDGRIWILQHNGAGWHVRAEQSIATAIVLAIWSYEKPASYYGWRSDTYLCWVTWDGTACQLHYIKEPIGGGSPEQDPTYPYAASAVEETPWFYGGFEDLYGAVLRLRVGGAKLTADETINVKYKLDGNDAAAWTNLGTFTNAVSELSWGANGIGVQWKSMRLQFNYARGATTTNTPLTRTFILAYDKKPTTRRAYIFTVDVSRMIAEQRQADTNPWTGFTATVDFKEVLDKLVAVKDTYVLVPFTYDNETTRYVKIQALPSTETEIHDSKRRGQIAVQVSEVI